MLWMLIISAAVVLLALPSPRAGRAQCSYRSLRTMDIDRRNSGWGRVALAALRVPGLWLDLTRGVAGSLLLLWSTEPARIPPALAESSPSLRAALVVLVAITSMLTSMARFRGTAAAPAPVAFMAGLIVGLCPLALCAIALVASGLLSFALKSLDAFFCALATALLAIGVLLNREPALIMIAAALALVPPLAAVLGGRQLMLPFHRWREF